MPLEQLFFRDSEGFPAALLDLPSWPECLYCHGTLRSQGGRGVAIVGARAATGEAMRAAQELARDLASLGHRIISGGALGVDAAAHRGALAGAGYTMAVMACGLDSYYPGRNHRLFQSILASGGALVSPFASGCPPRRSHFVRRNEVIAALVDLVVVVEASTGSGSLHTARFARQHGRQLAAYPGSAGCEALLARGVACVSSADDVLDVLDGKGSPVRVELPAGDSPECRVLELLSLTQAMDARQLADITGLSVRQIQRILLGLELRSLVLATPGLRYLRSPLAGPGSGEPVLPV